MVRRKNPAICKLYEFTKGGTDFVDQKFVHTQWSLNQGDGAYQLYLISVRVNASTIIALNHNKDFGMELAEALVNPQIKRRSKKGLQIGTLKKIDLVTGLKPVQDDQ